MPRETAEAGSPTFGSRVLDHFEHPRNVGIAADFNRRFLEENNPWLLKILLTLRVEEGRIRDVKFKTQSCVTTTASVSALTEMVKGKTVEEALSITPELLSERLGTVPPEKMYCCHLAVNTLRNALHAPVSPNTTTRTSAGGNR